MAMNMQTFKTRSLTAAIFVLVMLTGLLWNFWSFLILFSIVHFGCWYEFLKLVKKINGSNYQLYSLSGFLYITLPIVLFMDMGTGMMKNFYDSSSVTYIYSPILPCAIMFSIWINDTMAYIVGSLIGKTPFSKISPKKTWEGTAGGGLLCVIVISLIAFLSEVIPVKDAIAISAICAVFGTAGDLLESKIKRMGNVKDSGSIMPGHGGFLDRFDSLLIAAPFVWVYVKFFM